MRFRFLHIDGLDPGSTFLEGATLESVLGDLCQILPPEVSEENYKHKAWTLDMGRDFGWENLCSLQELFDQGLITAYEVGIMEEHHKNITQKNKSGTDEQKMAYVDGFNRRFPRAKIFLRIIRSPANVIIPHVVGQPHLTSQVMVALSTRFGQGRKKLHTFTPGRAMGRHPIPGEHRNPNRGTVDNQSFRNSAWNWTHHALLVPSRELPRL